MLDPACGSGNFLYVTLEHLKRLEAEVLSQLEAMGDSQARLGLEGETVTLQQLRGIEINARAAALAELVLWIGWLQWHIRTRGSNSVAEPVVHDYGNIECRDAVLAYDRVEPALDANGRVITRWDGKTTKPHPVTGEPVPDEAAQVAQWAYVNPRKAEWPAVDFIVGNPPFIGARTVRAALGDGYLASVRSVHPNVPANADFVMFWWDRCAEACSLAQVRRFGLITTNSIRQAFARKVIAHHLTGLLAQGIRLCIPDHPWVDAVDGAAIRIAMTVVDRSNSPGRLLTVAQEATDLNGEVRVTFDEHVGPINASLTIGNDLGTATALAANRGMSCVGKQPSPRRVVTGGRWHAGRPATLQQDTVL